MSNSARRDIDHLQGGEQWVNFDVPPSPQPSQGKTASLIGACLMIAVGLLGFTYFIESLSRFGTRPWLKIDNVSPWIVNLLLLIAFGMQHSVMARESWKRLFPQDWNRAIYVFASGLATGMLAIAWQPLPAASWWRLPDWFGVVEALPVLGILWCWFRMDIGAFLGTRPFLAGPSVEDRLDTSGPYRFVRHPLMFFTLLFLWLIPDMTATLGMLVSGLTVYILVGTVLEERDLERRFGDAYVAYRRGTPMLVPWRLGL